MNRKILAIIASLAMVCAMVPAVALAAVTDTGNGKINRETDTTYKTTVVSKVYQRTAEGELLSTQTSEETDGDISDEAVKNLIASMTADAKQFAAKQNRGVIKVEQGITEAYDEAYDEIVNKKDDSEPQPMSADGNQNASQGQVTIITHLVRHQTYTITVLATESVMPVFDANQETPLGTGEFQGLNYLAMVGEGTTPVEGTATFTVDGTSYSEIGFRGYLATLPLGKQKTVAYSFTASGDFQGFTDEGTITVTVVASQGFTMLEGANGSHKIGTDSTLTFRSNAPFGTFNRVIVDGMVVDADRYAVSEGSTVVTLTAKFLDSLEPGTHTIAIVNGEGPDAGSATASFTVVAADKAADATTKAETTAKTSDALPLAPLAVLAFAALALLLVAYRRKA